MRARRRPSVILVGLCSCLWQVSGGPSTQPGREIRTRDILNTGFIRKRPPPKRPSGPAASTSQVLARPEHAGDSLVGLTIWRLRRSQPPDSPRVRLLVHEQGEKWEFTPERVNSDTLLGEGDRVRISVESTRSGRLYVITREKYASGALGDPYLVFPTERLRGGDNRVHPGRVIDIPAWDDRPPYLTLRRSRTDQVAELLTVVVTPQALPELEPARGARRLDPMQVADWESRWKAEAKPLDAPELAGRPLTEIEWAAGAGHGLLHADDPLPQTVYDVTAKPEVPVLLLLELRLAAK